MRKKPSGSGAESLPGVPLGADPAMAIPPAPDPGLDNLPGLQANPSNPRTGWKPDQVAPFKASLKRFGDLGGIVLNLETGQLVGGHKRVAVFRTSDNSRIEKVDQPQDEQGTVAHGYVLVDGARFAYREVRWSPQVEAAANLAANKWAAEWEWERVSDTLRSIGDAELVSMTGFAIHELETLMAADWTPPVREALPGDDTHGHTVTLTAEQYAHLQAAKSKFVATTGGTAPADAAVVDFLAVAYTGGPNAHADPANGFT